MLQTYDYEMSEEVHNLLEELPHKWVNTKKLAVVVKQHVTPLEVIFTSYFGNIPTH